MARAKTNKSEKIREALAAHPTKTVAEIAKEFDVTPGLVYNVKAGVKKKKSGKGTKKRGRKPGRKAHATSAAPRSAHHALDTAFEFVTKVGGLMHAEQLIAKLRSIRERL